MKAAGRVEDAPLHLGTAASFLRRMLSMLLLSFNGSLPAQEAPVTSEWIRKAPVIQEWISPHPLADDQPFSVNGQFILLFAEPIVLGGKGKIRVTEMETGSLIPYSATTNNRLLTIRFEDELRPDARYVLQLLDGAVKGSAGGPETPFPGILKEFATGGGELRTEVIPLRHAWVEDRVIGTNVRVEGVEKIARMFFDAEHAKKGAGAVYAKGASLISDKVRNAFIIADTPDHIRDFKDFLKKFDVAPLLVEVSVAIIDLSTQAGFTWESQVLVGTGDDDLRTTDSKTTLRSGLGGGTNPLLPAPTIPVGSPPFLSGTGFTLNTLIKATRGDSLSILSSIQALETKGEAQILSRPAALTVNNRQVSLEDRLTFNVQVRGYDKPKLYPVTSGTNIRILPHVIELDDGRRAVRLVVWIDNGTAVTTTGNTIPAVATTTISTQAVVRENESLLIAGNYRHAEGRDESFVPILGKVPVLGWPFKNKAVNQTKIQRMFLITPKVLDADVLTLSRQSDRAAAMLSEEGADAAGLEMNWANEGQVQNALNVNEASGPLRKPLFPRLRRAWHTGQNP